MDVQSEFKKNWECEMSGSVTSWIRQFRAGNRMAADFLWEYFSPGLMKNLVPKCRRLKICDEGDIAVTAFYQLLEALEQPRETAFADQGTLLNRKEFWRLLRVTTRNELCDWVRYDAAKCRGGEQVIFPIEAYRDEGIASKPVSEDIHQQDAVDDELLERLRELGQRMDRDEFNTIIRLKLQGKKNTEIARELNVSLRTTQYLISEIKEAWLATFRAA